MREGMASVALTACPVRQEWSAMETSLRLRNQSKKIAELKAAVQAPACRKCQPIRFSSGSPVTVRVLLMSSGLFQMWSAFGPSRRPRGKCRLRILSC